MTRAVGFSGSALPTVDPITVEVVSGYLMSVLQSMSSRLIRSARSANITERRDVSTAILDATGRTVAQFEAAPLHLGEIIATGRYLLQNYPPAEINPGDAFIANDCYEGGGSHLPDVTIVAPFFQDGKFLGLVANLAHHVDIGGRPGGASGGVATIYEEGIRIPVTKIVDRGVLREDVLRLIILNCRIPEQRRADMLTQMAVNDLAVQDMAELFRRYPAGLVLAAWDELQRYSERRLRARVREIADGRYEFTDYLDDDGTGGNPIPIRVALEVQGDDLHVDFTGTAPQTEGNINLVGTAGTLGCVAYAVKAALDPTIPPTDGFLKAIRVTMPPGTIVNPVPPSGCAARSDTAQRVAGTLLGAFARALPGSLPAGSNDSLLVYNFSGVDHRNGMFFSYTEAFGGGSGARPQKDGLDAVQVHMANIANLPVEVAETEFPCLIHCHQFLPDTGGPGRFRGGLADRRELRLLAPWAWLGLHGDRQKLPPWGVHGGRPGVPGAIYVNPGTEGEKRMPAKIARYVLKAGEVVRLETPSGGGYGDPLERDPQLVLQDVANGRVTAAGAERDYGVFIAEQGVDWAVTAAVRARRREHEAGKGEP